MELMAKVCLSLAALRCRAQDSREAGRLARSILQSLSRVGLTVHEPASLNLEGDHVSHSQLSKFLKKFGNLTVS